jgi:hypothetical protein
LKKTEYATQGKKPWNPTADFHGNIAESHTVKLNDREVGWENIVKRRMKIHKATRRGAKD